MTTKIESTRHNKKLEKRQRIQDAAIKVMAQQGFHGTTVSQIAREAGVADGTLYLYFENKDELLIGIFDEIMDRFIREGLEILKQVADPLDQLREIAFLHLRNLGADDHLARIFQIEFRHNLRTMKRFSETKLREYFNIIEAVVRNAQTEGKIDNRIDPWITAKIFFGALDEMATNWVLRKKDYPLEAMVTPTLDILLNGMRTRG